MHPHQAPSPWTGGCISLPRPQKIPILWTKVTSWHRASTPGTLSVDRRLHFSSASTKTPPSVDKCHLQAPCIHARYPLRGQAIAFLFCVHKNTPICGQKSPPGTVRPRQAPSPWTGGNYSVTSSSFEYAFVEELEELGKLGELGQPVPLRPIQGARI